MVEIRLDLTAPHTHLVGVEIQLQPRRADLTLRLPAWTPGSYLIRDYVRQLEGLEVVQADTVLPTVRLGPAAWRVSVDPAGAPLRIRYRVLATELSVRTCHLDQDHGFLALAGVVLELEGERWTPHRLSCALPQGWRAFSTLSGDPLAGVEARDLDQLLDSPLELGPHRDQAFAVEGVPHRWVTWAGASGDEAWLEQHCPTLLSDVAAVCAACCRLMGADRPAAGSYLFILHLLDQGYGGLEHDDGCVLVYGRRNLLEKGGYRRFLQLVAHEYLHQWNVRRLRPAELCPIDYHQPVAVPSLWFAEGITSYLDQMLPLSAGLSGEEELLEDLGRDLSRYRLTPGRAIQSLRASSAEAWVKLYRADAYAPDSQVSYYLKGAVVALCLDLHLHGAGSCLAEVLRDLWQRLGRWGRGYRERDLLEAFATRCADLAERLPIWLDSVDDPDLDGYLRTVGLILKPVQAETPWSGLTAAQDPDGLVVRRVHRHGPGEQAGVMVGDELLGLDGQRLRQADHLSGGLQVGQEHALLISRRSRLITLNLIPAAPAVEQFRLERDPEAPPQALQRRRRWLELLPGTAMAGGSTSC